MPFKRPAPKPHPSANSGSQSESSSTIRPPKHARLSASAKALPDVKVYIVQAKLEGATLSDLFLLAEQHSAGLCGSAEDADVIITAVKMRRRFERHVPWELAKTKAIVTPDWLQQSVKAGKPLPCGDYAAIQDLRQETIKNCPDCNIAPCACSDGDSSAYPTPNTTPSTSRTVAQPDQVHPGTPKRDTSSRNAPPTPSSSARSTSSSRKAKSKPADVQIPAYLLPPDPPIPTSLDKLNYMSRYACQRASPLVCPNQGLVNELNIMRRARALEGEDRSALSYERAVSILKAYPWKITSVKQVEKLPFIGAKISSMIEEYLGTGKVSEAQTQINSERFQILTLFSSVYGIGPKTARRLHGLGLRTLDDLEVYYGPPDTQIVQIAPDTGRSKRGAEVSGKGEGDEGLGESWIRIALELREDLSKRIPRDEVDEMGRVVMAELDDIEPGCTSTIVGGHRRGKPESGDVDIVFTHPDPEKVKGLCKRLVAHLHEREMVTHVMHLSGFHSHNPLKTHHWDSLEKALTVFILPPSSPFAKGTRRRLDLIFAPPEVYWTAVIGWSGSIMFQRDLRQLAKDKFAMKFDSSGITRRYDSKQLFPKTEKEVFDLFELEWVDPIWRNADA